MKTWLKFAAILGAFSLTIYLTNYFSMLPESNCVTSEASSLFSTDRFYKATLLKKECNMAETTFYSVRIDKLGGPADRKWFFVEPIEQDPYAARPIEPRMKWEGRKLEVEIPAGEISGSIERRVEDLTLLRSYVAPNR